MASTMDLNVHRIYIEHKVFQDVIFNEDVVYGGKTEPSDISVQLRDLLVKVPSWNLIQSLNHIADSQP